MMRIAVTLGLCCCVTAAAWAAENHGLKAGSPDLKSAGALAFGPDGVLFVGDTASAAVFAIATGDTSGSPGGELNVAGIEDKIAGLLGTTARDLLVNDLAVNPLSGNVYLSVSRGRGPDAQPVLLRVAADGKLSEVSLKNVPFAKAPLPNAPAPGGTGRSDKRSQAITDLAFVDGRVFVAGLSNEEFESTLRSIPFPFSDVDQGTGVKIFHGAHGRFETYSPVRTFTHYKIGGESHLLAAYTCTPLVKFPISDLKPGAQLEGTTVAELGNRNRPLDMFVYNKEGRDYILLANSARGVMKIGTEKIQEVEGITEKISDTAGLGYDTIENLKGVEQLDRLNDDHAVVLVRDEAGAASLQTVALP